MPTSDEPVEIELQPGPSNGQGFHSGEKGQLLECPRCGSDAIYKYGKTIKRRQRFRCIICGRQFVGDKPRMELVERPVCPVCGRKMHIYMCKPNLVRFRCSGYPNCRNFLKLAKEEK